MSQQTPPVTYIRDPAAVAPLTHVVVDSGSLVVQIGGAQGAAEGHIHTFIDGGTSYVKPSAGEIWPVSLDSGSLSFNIYASLLQESTQLAILDQGSKAVNLQSNIDLNTANTALMLVELDETGTRQLLELQAIHDTLSGAGGGEVAYLKAIDETGTRSLAVQQSIKTNTQSTPADLEAIRQSGTRIATATASIASDVSNYLGAIETHASDIVNNTADISNVVTNTSTIPTINTNVGDIKTNTNDIPGIKTNTATLPSGLAALNETGTRSLLELQAIHEALTTPSGGGELGALQAIQETGTRQLALTSTGNSTLTAISTNTADLSAIRMSGTRIEGVVDYYLPAVAVNTNYISQDTLAVRMSGTRVEGLLGTTNSELGSVKTNTSNLPSDGESIRMSGTRVQGLISTGNSTLSVISSNTGGLSTDLNAVRMSGTRVEGLISTGNSTLTAIQSNTGGLSTDLNAVRMSGTRVEGLLGTGNASLSAISANTADLSAIRMAGTRQESILNSIATNTAASSGTRVALTDIRGNEIEVVTNPDTGGRYLGTAYVQDVHASTKNSTTTPLPAGATWTGLSESTLGVSGIQLTVKASTNCRVYVDQSGDGVNWDISDEYLYDARASSEGFGVTVQAVGAAFRVRVFNYTSTHQTTLRVNSALCPTVEALPRSLDQHGHLKVATFGMNDDFGFQGEFSPMRDLKTVQPYRLVGVNFAGTNDPNFWTCTNAGSNSYSSVFNGVAKVYSGGANVGYGQIQSVRPARFVFAHPHLYRSLIRVDGTLAPGNTRRWGPYTTAGNPPQPVDGFYFETNGYGTMSCNCISSGVVTYSATSGAFNGDRSEFSLDTNIHAYEIVHFVAGAWFYIDDVLMHKFKPAVNPLASTITLPVTVSSVNTPGITSTGTVDAWASTTLRLGRDITAPTSHFHPSSTTAGVTLKVGAGSLHGVVVVSVATNNAVLTIYDNTAASGRILYQSGALQTADRNVQLHSLNVPFYNGLTYSVTAQNAAFLFTYE